MGHFPELDPAEERRLFGAGLTFDEAGRVCVGAFKHVLGLGLSGSVMGYSGEYLNMVAEDIDRRVKLDDDKFAGLVGEAMSPTIIHMGELLTNARAGMNEKYPVDLLVRFHQSRLGVTVAICSLVRAFEKISPPTDD